MKSVQTCITARNDSDQPVDWWFLYKLPHAAGAPAGATGHQDPSTGYEYLYLDSDGAGPLAMSRQRLDTRDGALHWTLAALFGAGESAGWILYNDEIPGTSHNDGRKGHTKGVLGFDVATGSALWMLHSTPRFPHPDDTDFPVDERIYGQTFLCITLDGIDTARTLAGVMSRQQEPQTYSCRIPDALAADDPLRKLATAVDPNRDDPPEDVTFRSRGGQELRLLAKNRHWSQDFWIDWVGPRLGADFSVETWRRGTVPDTHDSDGEHDVRDVLYIDLGPLGVPYEWHYTKDHAKWATSESGSWVCVADINRQVSQEKRGGGAICFHHPALHASLSRVEKYRP